MVLDKGLAGRPSDFGKLFENTLRWLPNRASTAASSAATSRILTNWCAPTCGRSRTSFFRSSTATRTLPRPGNVYRGLIGARTRYSTGQGTVEEYAAAAKEAGLDFVVFLEEFGKKGGLTEKKYRKLEADCKRLSDDKLFLLPGFSFRNNIGNHMFAYGLDITWPTNTQFVGANGDELRHQCFDKEGNLAYNDEDAKNWLLTIPWLHCTSATWATTILPTAPRARCRCATSASSASLAS